MSTAIAPEAPAPAPSTSTLGALWKGPAGHVARVLFALLPIVWLARRVQWSDVVARARDVGVGGLAWAFAAVFVSTLFGVARWRTMMRTYGATATPPFATMLRHFLIGFYFNMLPSGVAGDAVRAHRLRAWLPDLTSALTVVFLERVAGLFGLCIVAATAMLLSSDLHDDLVAKILELGLLGALALSCVLLAGPWILARHTKLRGLVGRVPVVGTVVLRIPPARSAGGLLVAVLQSVATQSFGMLSVAIMVQALAPGVTLLTCARVVPAIILATYIPLTPGGVGQREFVFQYMLGLVGVAPAAAIATSLLFFSLMIGMAALGGLCLLAERVLGLEENPKP